MVPSTGPELVNLVLHAGVRKAIANNREEQKTFKFILVALVLTNMLILFRQEYRSTTVTNEFITITPGLAKSIMKDSPQNGKKAQLKVFFHIAISAELLINTARLEGI